MTSLQAMMIAALLVSGMSVALLGSIKVELARGLHIDEARVGGLVSIFGFSTIPVILTAGYLTDLVGRQVVFMAGSVLLGASLMALASATRYLLAFMTVVLLSAGWSLLINAGNVLTPVTFPGDTAAYATNLANVFFGLGAFFTPLAISLLLRQTSLSLALVLVGILALAPAVLALNVDFESLANVATGAAASGRRGATELSDPVLLLCGLALFFYTPLEASMAAWATTYLGGRGVKERTAGNLLSGFWLMFLGARLATALSLPAGQETNLIFVLSLACIGVLALVVLSRSQGLAMATVLAAGLIFGPIFPTVLAVLLNHFDENVHGRAVGLFFAIGGIGWTTVPALIGAYARRTNLQRGFLVAVAAAVGLSIVALILRS